MNFKIPPPQKSDFQKCATARDIYQTFGEFVKMGANMSCYLLISKQNYLNYIPLKKFLNMHFFQLVKYMGQETHIWNSLAKPKSEINTVGNMKNQI